jgi:hypothetical protein
MFWYCIEYTAIPPQSPPTQMNMIDEFLEELGKPFRDRYEIVHGDVCHFIMGATNPKHQRKGLMLRLHELVTPFVCACFSTFFY